MGSGVLRLGTRGSQLALWQSNWVKSALERQGKTVELIVIKTEGDVVKGALVNLGGQGLFTKQLQVALLENQIDLAVHSLKDLPTDVHPELMLAAVPGREDPRDVFVSAHHSSLQALPSGSRIGTGSVRRAAQVLHVRSDLIIADIRGNIDTRLKKVEAGEYDAIILAKAGLERLGTTGLIREVFEKETLMPAVGQGALAIEIRNHDAMTKASVELINHEPSYARVIAEREMLRQLQGATRR